jgi:hypothetical protein
LYKSGGSEEAGQDTPLKKSTTGERKTSNMIECSLLFSNSDVVIPMKITENRKGIIRIQIAKSDPESGNPNQLYNIICVNIKLIQ